MASDMVTVYSKPACVQCEATRRLLVKCEVPFRVVDISVDTQALAEIKALGYLQAPVVVFGEQSWSGFRPDRIESLSVAA